MKATSESPKLISKLNREHSVDYVFSFNGKEIKVSGCLGWSEEAARDYVATKDDFAKLFSAVLSSADNFIGKAYQEAFPA